MTARRVDVAIIDVGLGNQRSVERALSAAAEREGLRSLEVRRSADPALIGSARALVMPGQGAFRDGATRLRERGLDVALLRAIEAGVPYLGICLGLQLLFATSEEAPGVQGLGLLPGHVERLNPHGIKIPHMGWNQLEIPNPPAHAFLAAAGGAGSWMYFVHSYHALCGDPADLAAVVTHGENRIAAAVARGNVFATQFHPEKSQEAGLELLGAFLVRSVGRSG